MARDYQEEGQETGFKKSHKYNIIQNRPFPKGDAKDKK